MSSSSRGLLLELRSAQSAVEVNGSLSSSSGFLRLLLQPVTAAAAADIIQSLTAAAPPPTVADSCTDTHWVLIVTHNPEKRTFVRKVIQNFKFNEGTEPSGGSLN